MYRKRLRTGFRYARGCWRGMSDQIFIVVSDGYIVSARQGKQEWIANDRRGRGLVVSRAGTDLELLKDREATDEEVDAIFDALGIEAR